MAAAMETATFPDLLVRSTVFAAFLSSALCADQPPKSNPGPELDLPTLPRTDT